MLRLSFSYSASPGFNCFRGLYAAAFSLSTDAYFAREVLPYAPDAWMDKKKTKIGYEIPMTRYFYEYTQPEASEDILSRIIGLEDSISASLKNLFGED